MRRYLLRVLLLLIALLPRAGSAPAAPLLFSGSSTVQKCLLEPAAKVLAKKTGVTIEVNGAGTVRGIKDLMSGTAVAAMASCPLDVAFQETGIPTQGTYQEHVIAQDTVVTIVHPSNRIKGLTQDQLAGIQSGKIANWKDVGGPDERIVVVVPPASSGTRLFVRDAVLKGAPFAANAYVTVTDREAIDIVAKSPIAVSILSEGFVKGNGKKVKTVKTQPLKRQLCIITRDEPSPDLAKVIKFLQSKEAKKLFK